MPEITLKVHSICVVQRNPESIWFKTMTLPGMNALHLAMFKPRETHIVTLAAVKHSAAKE